jgi:hypothetical protein
MKKIAIAIFAVTGLLLVSCKKDRVCECTYTSTYPGSTSETDKFTLLDIRKKDAKSLCIKTVDTYESNGTTYTSTSDCKLK